ncbi:bifunctional phosphoribosyl-AMP cyclohydrolase/phosphoribosyl-ATP diphosphatase HisIE [Anoxybacterium hadale]|uniref:Bifunctional phosphoribosyl-AMP cyclohydrolase/phosphoribosyl-ATP diphosphatase HisIE n=1 Tax=Anoxybacterium hadale TaxID=3408580 RepID=A0ACD1AFQ2_9FIRM|nr:bifunctional phosphoribosyl-AMP cyclohydrolase/phosphoribosyl-ATP diphosphatase HisIE [Clostridiales bacterium]
MDLSKYFVKSALIPAIIQDAASKKVLMLAYMNQESLQKTIETGYTWFFSRSRNELWNKGATSGHVQKVVRITGDCDDDTLLIEVEQTGPACHTGSETCFYQESLAVFGSETSGEGCGSGGRSQGERKHDDRVSAANNDRESVGLEELYQVVVERHCTYTENSYTCYLFEKGLDKILKKCGEECSEVIIAAKNAAFLAGDEKCAAAEDTKNEICDLLYHLTVLMVNEGITLDEINEILKERSRKIGNLKTFHSTNHNS